MPFWGYLGLMLTVSVWIDSPNLLGTTDFCPVPMVGRSPSRSSQNMGSIYPSGGIRIKGSILAEWREQPCQCCGSSSPAA